MKIQKEKMLEILHKHLDLLNWKKNLIENIVFDMQRVEEMKEYQDLLEERLEIVELIETLEDKSN